MTTEVINIQIREDGSRVVARNIDGIGGAADRASGPLDRLKGLIATLVTGAAVTQLGRLADEYTNLQNRLRLVTTGTENLNRVTKELLGIANQTRSDFTATGELYARLASTTKELGLSQQELLDFTKRVNQAIVLSGASAQEAAGGLRQFAQGLASGVLRGDELNSVMENFPKVAEIIAEGMGRSIGEIRKLGSEGKITAQEIVDAFAKAGATLDEEFGTTVPTLSQSFTVLKNNFLVFIGQLNESTGVTAKLSELIMSIANNLDTLIPILAGVGTAIAVAFSVGPIKAFTAQLKALYAVAMANPWLALATVVAGLITTLYTLRDQIKLGIDETTTLGDLMRAAWEAVGPAITAVADLVAQFFGWLTQSSAGTFSELVDQSLGYQHQNEAMWLKLVRVVVQVFDMIGGVIRGTMAGVHAVIMNFVAAWMNNFKQLGNAIDGIKELDAGKIKAAIASNLEGYKLAATGAGEAFSSAFQQEILSQADSGLESYLDQFIARAQEIGKERLANQAGQGELNPGGPRTIKTPVDEEAAKKAARELERLKDALRNVLDAANPVDAAHRRLAEAQDILNRSVAAGLITQEAAAQAYENLAFQMRDQLDPLAALNRAIDENIDLLKMSADQANIEGQLRRMVQDLQRDGVQLTKEETDALRAKLIVEQELDRISRARDSIEQGSSKSQMRGASDTLAAMEQLEELTSGDKFNVLNSLLGGTLDETQAAFDAQIEQFQNYYAVIEQFRQQDTANEELASQARRAIKQQEMDLYLQRTSEALGAASSLMKSNNKEAFRIGQAAAIGQTIVNTYAAATAAYKSAANIPYVGWILGPVAAAGAIAAGMAQVSAIRSQQMPAYRTGGTYTVGGYGGVDSQLVSFRATPGEQVSINTPAQANAMQNIEQLLREDRQQRGRGGITQNLTIVQQGKPNNKTPEQEARAMFKAGRKLVKVRS